VCKRAIAEAGTFQMRADSLSERQMRQRGVRYGTAFIPLVQYALRMAILPPPQRFGRKLHKIGTYMIYIDCTDTVTRSYSTGIQRVVRRIIGELSKLHPMPICPVMAVNGRFYPINDRGLKHLAKGSNKYTKEYDGFIKRLFKGIIKKSVNFDLYLRHKLFQSKAQVARKKFAEALPCKFDKNDKMLLLDSYWGGPDTLAATKRAAKEGCAIIGYVHDLIPITHPHVMPLWQQVATSRSVREVAKISCGIITTTEYCSSTVRDFIGEKYDSLKIIHNYHGADFLLPKSSEDKVVKPNRLKNLEGQSYYVMVGTIEPRKGHDVVLAAFESLWFSGSELGLVFIGSVGWVDQTFADYINAHPELNKKLFLLHDASDDDIYQIYNGANAAIVASQVEGFGLPVVEALGAGVPLIASDIPVFREIAGEHALFFSARDAASLADTITRFETGERASAKDFVWPTWQISAQNMINQIDSLGI
jgi:alpha-1,2-rhamnosyltransferase